MVRLYLDVETERKGNQPFRDEKLIAVGIIEKWNENDINDVSNRREEVEILSEWKLGNEKNLIEEFFKIIKSLLAKFHLLEIVGFNIVKFDIPFLTQKAREYTLDSLPAVNELWWQTFITDIKQVALPLFNMDHHNSLHQLVKKVKKWDPSIPSLYGQGDNVYQWYQEGEFGEIERHLTKDVKAIEKIYETTAHWNITYASS